ncbi:Hypothetical_protein [Hexamita inflata]|uniref:Hypothetical_protein n=1 Tax=Hexamita inflata TaxID=28002 RepID=A0AA86N6T9_9EUKA|nr:Hypothetical protein HINF_LOCUS1555 [Hexamita inflata]
MVFIGHLEQHWFWYSRYPEQFCLQKQLFASLTNIFWQWSPSPDSQTGESKLKQTQLVLKMHWLSLLWAILSEVQLTQIWYPASACPRKQLGSHEVRQFFWSPIWQMVCPLQPISHSMPFSCRNGAAAGQNSQQFPLQLLYPGAQPVQQILFPVPSVIKCPPVSGHNPIEHSQLAKLIQYEQGVEEQIIPVLYFIEAPPWVPSHGLQILLLDPSTSQKPLLSEQDDVEHILAYRFKQQEQSATGTLC